MLDKIKKLHKTKRLESMRMRKAPDGGGASKAPLDFKIAALTAIIDGAEKRAKNEKPKDTDDVIITESHVIASINSVIKKAKDLLDLKDQSAVSDAARTAAVIEIETATSLLPKSLTEDELKDIIVSIAGDHFDNSSRGPIMKHLKENYNGRFDGKMVNTLIGQMVGK